MILNITPVSFAEVQELVKDSEEKKELKDYLKKYCKISKKDAMKLMEEVRDLKNIKVREEHIVKIADFLPKHAEELQKIFSEISLDEKETNEIIGIVQRY